ncbi:helix-turn-helix domain-containing protein [Caulobacter sp. KR2-114]|uniref:AraC family transcriptional regulator n=1 Tax=Caulobacter sp. KR2-114 TaxID=3400912 RepID=UPI003C114CA5
MPSSTEMTTRAPKMPVWTSTGPSLYEARLIARRRLEPVAYEPEFQIVSQESRSWTCAKASQRNLRCTGSFDERVRSNHPRLRVLLEQVGGDVSVESEDASPSAVDARGAHASLIPADLVTRQRSENVRFLRDLTVDFEPSRIEAAAGRPVDISAAFEPRLMFRDDDVLHLSRLMAAECHAGHPAEQLYGDSLSLALVLRLTQLNRSTPTASARGGLAPWQLRKVIDCLQSHLSDGVDIQTLANMARLSQSYFVRAFKASIGQTPSAWLRGARIKRAQELLVDRRWPLAQIAVETGFADQAHLSRVFRVATGESPGAWRRARLGMPA